MSSVLVSFGPSAVICRRFIDGMRSPAFIVMRVSLDLVAGWPSRLRRPVAVEYADAPGKGKPGRSAAFRPLPHGADRKSAVWGKSVSVRVDLGGRRTISKKNNTNRQI